jgi:hypothetical protein
MAGTESKIERERQARFAADAKRKPVVTAAHVDALWNVMTPETRVHIAMLAAQRLRIQPPFAPKK